MIDRWRSVPLEDIQGRSGVLLLRLVLAFVAVIQCVSIVRIALDQANAASKDPLHLWLALASMALILACFVLLQRNGTRLAALAFVSGTLALFTVACATWGGLYASQNQLGQVYPLLIGGLLLGRCPLWGTALWMSMALALGIWRDLQVLLVVPEWKETIWQNGLGNMAQLVLIALILDRGVQAWRANMRTSARRADELARAHQRLLREVEEKEQSRKQLFHAQKVEAVGRMASGVAHDFGNLLSLILGYAAQARNSQDPARLKELAAGMESAARRATLVTHKLLNFSRQDETVLQTFDPAECLHELRPMLRQSFDPSVSIVMDPELDLAQIRFDRAQFELLVLNIAANANHAMPEGGQFRVSMEVRDHKRVVFEFGDTGTGMPTEVTARVFEPFFTTKPAGQGTGLGLAVVRDLVTGAGGNIAVDSAPGTGTRIRIDLPAVMEDVNYPMLRG